MIKGIRLGDDLIKTRIVLDLTSIPEYAITEEDGGKQLKILMFNTMGRMHGDAQFAGSSSVPAHVDMMGLIGAGNNPMVGMSVAVAVAVAEAMNK